MYTGMFLLTREGRRLAWMWLFVLFIASVFAELTKTPFGVFPADCVHKVPSGSHITTVEENTVVRHNDMLWKVPACDLSGIEKRQFPSNYNGW